eukprot:361491-Chlamydomonas_euryale.AAC.7
MQWCFQSTALPLCKQQLDSTNFQSPPHDTHTHSCHARFLDGVVGALREAADNGGRPTRLPPVADVVSKRPVPTGCSGKWPQGACGEKARVWFSVLIAVQMATEWGGGWLDGGRGFCQMAGLRERDRSRETCAAASAVSSACSAHATARGLCMQSWTLPSCQL